MFRLCLNQMWCRLIDQHMGYLSVKKYLTILKNWVRAVSRKQRQVVLQERKQKQIFFWNIGIFLEISLRILPRVHAIDTNVCTLVAYPRSSQCVCAFACTHDAANPVQASVQLQLRSCAHTNMCSFKLDIIRCKKYFVVVADCYAVPTHRDRIFTQHNFAKW